MPHPKKSPSELYQLADSFSVIGADKVRLALGTQSDAWTEDYLLPVDITTGSIQTARIDSSPFPSKRHKAGDHLGRAIFKLNAWDSTVRLRLSNPRLYLSPAPMSRLDAKTPAVLPKNYFTRPGAAIDWHGGGYFPYTETVREYDVALLDGRRVSGDRFLYEDEVKNPDDCNDTGDTLKLLTILRDHIRKHGTLTAKETVTQ